MIVTIGHIDRLTSWSDLSLYHHHPYRRVEVVMIGSQHRVGTLVEVEDVPAELVGY